MQFSIILIMTLASALPRIAEVGPHVYEPVLLQMREEYPEQPLILYDAPLKAECLRGGCDRPWADPHPKEWLESIKAERLIAEHCTYQRGLCVGPTGEPVHRPNPVYVTLTTETSCGQQCAEIMATLVMASGDCASALKRYMLYRLHHTEDGWALVSAVKLADGYIGG